MKICPYALSGAIGSSYYYESGHFAFLEDIVQMNKAKYDKLVPFNDKDGFIISVACKGKNCGRYALCNQETTQKK